MSDNEPTTGGKTLGLSRPGRLELQKTVEGGQVQQSFSHGRKKTVQVEVKKKRTFKRGSAGRMTEVTEVAAVKAAAAAQTAPKGGTAPTGILQAPTAANLTDRERAARQRAVEGAIKAELVARARAEDEARVAEDERRRAEAEAAEAKRLAEAEDVRAAEAAAATESEAAVDAQAKAKPAPAVADAAVAPKAKRAAETKTETTTSRPKPARKRADDGAAAPPRGNKRAGSRLSIERRQSGRKSIAQALSGEERQRSLASVRRQREREKRALREQGAGVDTRKVVREVVVPEAITVQELANRMATRGAEVIKGLMRLGVMVNINQTIDADTAELVISEFGHKIKRVSEADVEIGLGGPEDSTESLRPRPPVVTVMGHVDHGKTTLLDALRQTDVASREAGGITQHLGAYQVTLPSGRQITFIDTPGHAAFTQMRARGAKTTDIVVLVVAADDGVMPQTVEAIQHAQAAEVPMIIAINKMDRPDATPDRVRNELLQHNVVVESLGGDQLEVEISAKDKTGLDKLEELIVLQADMRELSANPARAAEGIVLESRRDRGRGVVTTLLVQRGTMRVGDIVVAGAEYGRVRAMTDDRGRTVSEVLPASPVEVLGLSDTPLAGDSFVVVENESRARDVTEFRTSQARDQEHLRSARGSVEQMLSDIKAGERQEVQIVLKADVHGSMEAILSSLEKLSTDEVSARVMLSGVGGINESDIALAHASGALVIGFNVRADAPARERAKRDKVDIRYYSVIYELLDHMRDLMSGLLAPTERETTLGYARIKEVFNITKIGKVAGCEVTEGVVRRGARMRLLRDNVVIHDGAIKTLKRHKDEVREVKQGLECGMVFDNYQDVKESDMIEIYDIERIARELQA